LGICYGVKSMRLLYEQFMLRLNNWTRRYICDEDPDERRKRLRAEALKEVDAQVLPAVQLRVAMQDWERDLEKSRERNSEAA